MCLLHPAGELFDNRRQFGPCSRIKTAGIYRFADIIGIGGTNLEESRYAERKKNRKNQTENLLHVRIDGFVKSQNLTAK